MTDLEMRFWDKVKIGDGCWEWRSSRRRNGYGQFHMERRTRAAHQVSWILERGAIPKDMCVLHRCDSRVCVRPGHLFLGTRADNNADMDAKGRRSRGAAHAVKTRGEGNGWSKLDAAKVLDIRTRDANGESRRSIADSFGVTISTVSRTVLGQTWDGGGYTAGGAPGHAHAVARDFLVAKWVGKSRTHQIGPLAELIAREHAEARRDALKEAASHCRDIAGAIRALGEDPCHAEACEQTIRSLLEDE